MKYLYEAQRYSTMNAASEAMDVAPSSVTRQIAALEKELGVEMIEKGRRGIKLTEAGILAVNHYAERCAQEEVFLSQLDSLKRLRSGTVKIAIGEGFVSDDFSRIINNFLAEYDGIVVDILLAKTNHISDLVKEDEIHFGLIFDTPKDPKIRTKAEFDQPIKAILPPNHPLASRKSLKLEEIAQEKIALPNKSYRIRQIIDRTDTFLEPKLTSNSLHLLREYVKTENAITFMPEIAVFKDLVSEQIVSRPTDNPILNSTKISLITRLGRQLPVTADILLQLVRNHLTSTLNQISKVSSVS
nr:LysR family transcriptional regulator [Aestuariicella hydrocarbonica]